MDAQVKVCVCAQLYSMHSSPGTGQATKSHTSFLIVTSIPIKPVFVDCSPKQQLPTHMYFHVHVFHSKVCKFSVLYMTMRPQAEVQ